MNEFGVVADSYRDFLEWCRETGHDPSRTHFLDTTAEKIRGCRFKYVIITKRAQGTAVLNEFQRALVSCCESFRLSNV